MPQINSVRQEVPVQQTPVWAGALQGLGQALSLRQAREAQRREETMNLLPTLANMKMLQPAGANDPGAIEVGEGLYVKVVPRGTDYEDEYRKAATAKIKYEMSPNYEVNKALDKFAEENRYLYSQEDWPAVYQARKEELQKQYDATGSISDVDETILIRRKGTKEKPREVKRSIFNNASDRNDYEEVSSLSAGEDTGIPQQGQGVMGKIGGAIGDYYTNEQGDLDIGRLVQTAPVALPAISAGLKYGFPLLGQALPTLSGPVGWGLSALALGANLGLDYQERKAKEDVARAAAETERPTPAMSQYELSEYIRERNRRLGTTPPTPTGDELTQNLLRRYANNPEMTRLLSSGMQTGSMFPTR